MTYRQLQAQLKIYRQAGYAVPRLNSKKEILAAALEAIAHSLLTEAWTKAVNAKKTGQHYELALSELNKVRETVAPQMGFVA